MQNPLRQQKDTIAKNQTKETLLYVQKERLKIANFKNVTQFVEGLIYSIKT